MSAPHHHAHVRHALAEAPTLSLLRLSAWQRLAATGLVTAALWLTVAATIGWV